MPTDGNTYNITDTVTVLGNTGSLVKTGYTFAGWNTAANGSGTSYSGGETFAMGSSDVTLYAQWTENTYTVTYTGNTNTGGSVPTDATTYHNGDTATVLGNTGSLTKTGYTFAGWNTAANGSGTSYSGGDTFAIGSSNVTLYAQWTENTYGGTGSSSTDSATVYIDGESFSAGQMEFWTYDGQTRTRVTLDADVVAELLSRSGNGARVTIPIASGSDSVSGVLNGQIISSMQQTEAIVEVQSGTSSYTIPASEISIETIARQFGENVSLSDIQVSITIARPNEETIRIVENAAENGGFALMLQAVEFSVTCSYNGNTLEVQRFDSYVERMVEIPGGVDPDKITTAIVVAPDGTVHHVPTRIILVNGKYYARVHSLTNSIYTFINYEADFTDTNGHWAEAEIRDMASRKIVNGRPGGAFMPDERITRAEFTAIIIRALGLSEHAGGHSFSDISSGDWYCGAAETAVDYGIVTGYSNGAFGPNDQITREQAMTMISRAMAITGLSGNLTAEEDFLDGFDDASDVSAYAREAVAACLDAGIITGRSHNTLAPGASMTRAEVAAVAQRLLQQSGLI